MEINPMRKKRNRESDLERTLVFLRAFGIISVSVAINPLWIAKRTGYDIHGGNIATGKGYPRKKVVKWTEKTLMATEHGINPFY